MIDICMFPIPGCVTFPGTVFPLHVFEPRYRDMVHHCLETDTPVAICHTVKELSPGKHTDDLSEALSSNQATYRPQDVFSAGRCQLLETAPDGRLLLNVHIEQRYRRDHEVQLLPYQIHTCTPFPDRAPTRDEQTEMAVLRDKILHRLQALSYAEPDIRRAINHITTAPEWQAKSDADFSMALFGVVRFEPELMQELLEMDSAHQRLTQALALLNAVD
ncbi:LON peptidase substrate-binding domain-containing protein [Marinobacterium weihaiense]|uniref:LON peptidase substrate-binding domain-containing protein n=1 Tax=Marinobacterium weihaiense TaxID=2851016 RepID=A0ABS6MDA8_9GAMM|nr:LON peptidase substrate-binding domain-containing protein [Marinobacterium weihaiense]MBV0934288.1 LON peptidase substrate-binding domain-containing protein [Marinobacterium weihaiense]